MPGAEPAEIGNAELYLAGQSAMTLTRPIERVDSPTLPTGATVGLRVAGNVPASGDFILKDMTGTDKATSVSFDRTAGIIFFNTAAAINDGDTITGSFYGTTLYSMTTAFNYSMVNNTATFTPMNEIWAQNAKTTSTITFTAEGVLDEDNRFTNTNNSPFLVIFKDQEDKFLRLWCYIGTLSTDTTSADIRRVSITGKGIDEFYYGN